MADLYPCGGPERCMDDICRASSQGMCGLWRDEEADFGDDEFGCGQHEPTDSASGGRRNES